MLEVFFSQTTFAAAHQLVNEIVRIATYFLTFGVVVYFIAMLMRQTTERERDSGVYHLFFIVFAVIGLATYRIWAVWLGKLFVLLARAIFDLESGNILSDYLGNFFANSEGTGLRLSVFNIFTLESLSSLSYMMVMVVYEIFVIIQVIVQIFFYLLGPLAIVISLFPNFRDVFRVWLSNFCAVNFWSVLAAILFRLVKALTSSPSFQASVQNGEKGVLWDTFILGVIISVALVLIPKFASGIFSRANASADLGTYGVGITAGVVLSTVWSRLKGVTTQVTRNVTAGTAGTIVAGAQALSTSPVASSSQALAESLGRNPEMQNASWPFRGSAQPHTRLDDMHGE